MYQAIHPDQVWNSFYWIDPIVKQKGIGWIHNDGATVEPMGKSCKEGQFCTGLQHWGRSLISFLSQHFLLLWKLSGRKIDSWLVQDWFFFLSQVQYLKWVLPSAVGSHPRPDDALFIRLLFGSLFGPILCCSSRSSSFHVIMYEYRRGAMSCMQTIF